MIKYFSVFILIFALVLSSPRQASAVDWFPLVPCGLNQQPVGATRKDTLPDGTQVPHDYTQPCNQCLLIELGKNGIDMTFFAIVPSVGTLLFLYAGFKILLGAREGKSAQVAEAQKIMKTTATGIAIILSSWLIANFILKSIANDQVAATPWYQIQCRTGTLLDITLGGVSQAPNQNQDPAPNPNPGPNPAPNPVPGTPAQCTQSSLNLCQGDGSQGCANTSCSQYASMVTAQADGVATANVLKAFMETESSCEIKAHSDTSFGLMGLKPATANIYASRCGVSAGSVDGDWLMDPANAEKSICIAAKYIDAISKSQCGTAIRNIYAGYNGGESGAGSACAPSISCKGESSCSGEAVRRWECLYDDAVHATCNTGYDQTRKGATRVQFCATNPGF